MKADPGSDSADASSRTRLRVLIVEDSEDDALLLLRELRLGGYEPASAERVDTPEAMRWALAEGEPWDVVLSDWRMPRFSATEALAMLRATNSEAPFVIVSGKVGEEAAVEAMRSGAHDYVMKGNLARLCATVERGLQEAETRRERRRAEEERDRLFEFSLDLLGVAGLDGYFKRVNPAFEETLGYPSGELLARPLIDFVHPEDRAATKSELESLGKGVRTAYFENRYLREDGSEVWLEWKATPVLEEGLIYATARDVTERKRAEEELRRRESILRAVAFAAECFLKKAAYWEKSIEEVLKRLGQAADASRVYIFENYRGEDGELWGTQRYEWVATGVSAQMDNPLMQAIPYRAAGYGRWEELLSRGELVHGHTQEFSEEEQRELREQDILSIVIVPIFVEGEWWGLIGFDECTSEREWSAAEIDALKAAADTLGAAIVRTRAERALRESEERFRATFDQAAVGVAHVSPHGSWLRVNEKLCEIVGYTREELLGGTLPGGGRAGRGRHLPVRGRHGRHPGVQRRVPGAAGLHRPGALGYEALRSRRPRPGGHRPEHPSHRGRRKPLRRRAALPLQGRFVGGRRGHREPDLLRRKEGDLHRHPRRHRAQAGRAGAQAERTALPDGDRTGRRVHLSDRYRNQAYLAIQPRLPRSAGLHTGRTRAYDALRHRRPRSGEHRQKRPAGRGEGPSLPRREEASSQRRFAGGRRGQREHRAPRGQGSGLRRRARHHRARRGLPAARRARYGPRPNLREPDRGSDDGSHPRSPGRQDRPEYRGSSLRGGAHGRGDGPASHGRLAWPARRLHGRARSGLPGRDAPASRGSLAHTPAPARPRRPPSRPEHPVLLPPAQLSPRSFVGHDLLRAARLPRPGPWRP